MLHKDRLTAEMEGDFVVFLIGARINRFWKINKWLPVLQAMPRMLKELMSTPGSGLLAYEMWFGRTTLMVQYWKTFEQLDSYARNRKAAHLPAWTAFNKHVGTNGDVGIWHETYLIAPGKYESVYVNMPTFGLGKAGQLVGASGNRESAAARIKYMRDG